MRCGDSEGNNPFPSGREGMKIVSSWYHPPLRGLCGAPRLQPPHQADLLERSIRVADCLETAVASLLCLCPNIEAVLQRTQTSCDLQVMLIDELMAQYLQRQGARHGHQPVDLIQHLSPRL